MTSAGLLILAAGLFVMAVASYPLLVRLKEGGHQFQVFTALRYRNFRWFWINAATQSMGQGMQILVLGLLVLDVTGSSVQLGLVAFIYGTPNLLFSMLGGIIADRSDRLRLLISTRFGVSVLVFVLAIMKIFGVLEIWHVYVIMFLLGTVQALNNPARQALVADLVERKDMMNAVALHTTVNQSGQIVGPALAGGIIELAGTGPALLVNAGMYLAGILFLFLIKDLPPRAPGPKASLVGDLLSGLRHIRSTPVLYTIIGMALAFTFFAMSYRQVLPAFTRDMLDVGAGGTGLLWLSAGLGSLLGSLIVASLGDFRHKARLMVGSLLLLFVVLTLFAWSPWYWASWVLFFFVGVTSLGLFWTLATTLVQLNVPNEVRGRVMSVLQLAPAVHFLSGLLLAVGAEAVGWPIAITGTVVMTLMVTVWLGIWRPVLRRLEE
ncbi:MAG: MFS transporter [Chloroflexota bacterium]|nr:MFS transporter [Chloroflexota bacterium]MED5569230.1 MFS transporter [Chloroflexota bacterium]